MSYFWLTFSDKMSLYPLECDEAVMSQKKHGTTEFPVQKVYNTTPPPYKRTGDHFFRAGDNF